MLHPHTELRHIDREIGYGVFTTRPIPMGTITWVLDPLDRVIDLEREPHFRSYPDTLERYTFVNADGHYVLCWDLARFINHSCEANCLSPGFDFEIAIRDIGVDEQLTNDYGSLNLEHPMVCRCGAHNCRGMTRPEDFSAQAPRWDSLLRVAFPRLGQVPQPLWDWVREKMEVEICLAQPDRLPSILRHRYPGLVDPRQSLAS